MSVTQMFFDPLVTGGRCRRLAEVLTITQEMLDHARDGDWDSVTRLEHQRRADLAECFGADPVSENAELVAEALAALLHLNEELMALLRKARDAVLIQGAEQARARSAIGLYQGVKHGAS